LTRLAPDLYCPNLHMKLKIKHQHEIGLALQMAVILLGLLALGVGGANEAARTFTGLPQDYPTVTADGQSATGAAIADAVSLVLEDEDGGEMAPGPRPDVEPRACLAAPAPANGPHENDRLKHPLELDFEDVGYQGSSGADVSQLGSVCLISTSLGRQFTLVGAKPSGTS